MKPGHWDCIACTSAAELQCVTARYDVELYQRIEALTGQRMEQYAPEEDAVMLLLERTGEAQRIASMQVGCACRPAFACACVACIVAA